MRQKVKGKRLSQIDAGMAYLGCTFYLENHCWIKPGGFQPIFDNCTFRSQFKFKAGLHDTRIPFSFTNCTYPAGVVLDLSGPCKCCKRLTALFKYFLSFFDN